LPASTAFALVLLAIGLDWLPANTSTNSRTALVARSTQNRIESEKAFKGGVRNALCTGENGIAFSITNQNGLLTLSYNGGAPVQPKIDAQGDLTVLRVKTDAGSRIDIGLFKGDKDGVIVSISDEPGNAVKTMGAKCSSAVF
jgi:hypothetical protein